MDINLMECIFQFPIKNCFERKRVWFWTLPKDQLGSDCRMGMGLDSLRLGRVFVWFENEFCTESLRQIL